MRSLPLEGAKLALALKTGLRGPWSRVSGRNAGARIDGQGKSSHGYRWAGGRKQIDGSEDNLRNVCSTWPVLESKTAIPEISTAASALPPRPREEPAISGTSCRNCINRVFVYLASTRSAFRRAVQMITSDAELTLRASLRPEWKVGACTGCDRILLLVAKFLGEFGHLGIDVLHEGSYRDDSLVDHWRFWLTLFT